MCVDQQFYVFQKNNNDMDQDQPAGHQCTTCLTRCDQEESLRLIKYTVLTLLLLQIFLLFIIVFRSTFADMKTNTFNLISSVPSEVFSAIGGVMEGTYVSTCHVYKTISTTAAAIAEIPRKFISTLSTLTNTIPVAMKDVIQQIVHYFSTTSAVLDNVFTSGYDTCCSFASSTRSAIPGILSFAQNSISSVTDKAVTGFSSLSELFCDVAAKLVSMLPGLLNFLFNVVLATGEIMGLFCVTVFELSCCIASTIAGTIPPLLGAVLSILSTIGSVTIEGTTWILYYLRTVLSAVGDTVPVIAHHLSVAVSTVVITVGRLCVCAFEYFRILVWTVMYIILIVLHAVIFVVILFFPLILSTILDAVSTILAVPVWGFYSVVDIFCSIVSAILYLL